MMSRTLLPYCPIADIPKSRANMSTDMPAFRSLLTKGRAEPAYARPLRGPIRGTRPEGIGSGGGAPAALATG